MPAAASMARRPCWSLRETARVSRGTNSLIEPRRANTTHNHNTQTRVLSHRAATDATDKQPQQTNNTSPRHRRDTHKQQGRGLRRRAGLLGLHLLERLGVLGLEAERVEVEVARRVARAELEVVLRHRRLHPAAERTERLRHGDEEEDHGPARRRPVSRVHTTRITTTTNSVVSAPRGTRSPSAPARTG